MKDFLNNELKIDDYVIMITPSYRDFSIAKIVSFTPKYVNVIISRTGRYGPETMRQAPSQLIKIPEDDVPRIIFEKKLSFS